MRVVALEEHFTIPCAVPSKAKGNAPAHISTAAGPRGIGNAKVNRSIIREKDIQRARAVRGFILPHLLDQSGGFHDIVEANRWRLVLLICRQPCGGAQRWTWSSGCGPKRVRLPSRTGNREGR